jgi:hypothetical protein
MLSDHSTQYLVVSTNSQQKSLEYWVFYGLKTDIGDKRIGAEAPICYFLLRGITTLSSD